MALYVPAGCSLQESTWPAKGAAQPGLAAQPRPWGRPRPPREGRLGGGWRCRWSLDPQQLPCPHEDFMGDLMACLLMAAL